VATIQAKPVPQTIAEPIFDLDDLFVGLALSLDNVHADAENVVKQHIAKLGGEGAENWLSQGRQFENDSTCPFCDQGISSNDLVKAYQTHFNAAYTDLKSKVATLQTKMEVAAATSIVDSFAKSVKVVAAQAESWSDHVPTQPVVFDVSAAESALITFRDFVTDLVHRKKAAPPEPVGSPEDKAKAIRLWDQFLAHIRTANSTIQAATGLISGYKAKLSTDNTTLLQQQMKQLEATKRRYDPVVVDLFTQLATARTEAEIAEKTKKRTENILTP
jgi:wobble nucleotide-excising tRNase